MFQGMVRYADEIEKDLIRRVAEVLVPNGPSAELIEALSSSLRPLLRYNCQDIFLSPSLLPVRLHEFLHKKFLP